MVVDLTPLERDGFGRSTDRDTACTGYNGASGQENAWRRRWLFQHREVEMERTIVLVSCVSSKREAATRAEELYTSPLFQKASSYARQIGDEWYILSAEHGLLDPKTVIKPYDKTLNKMPAAARRTWARRVVEQLQGVLRPGDCVVFLAGKKYRENLVTRIREMNCSIEVPMEGLGIGRQLRWLNQHLEGR